MSPARPPSALAATAWAYAQSWTARGLGLLIFLLLARLLNPQDFGAFAIAAMVLALSETVLEQGLSSALVQREDLQPEHLNAAFWGALAIGALLAVLAALCAQPLAQMFDAPAIATLMLGLAPVFLLMAAAVVPAAKLRRDLNYQWLARRALLANLLAGAAAVATAARGHGAWAFVINQWVYQAVSLALLWGSEPWRPSRFFSALRFRELFGFSSRVSAAKLLDYLEARALEFWVAHGIGLGALGQYSFASRNAQAGQQMLAGPIWDSALGILSRLQGEQNALKESLLRLLRLAGWIAFPPLVFVIAAAPLAVPLAFGEKWRASIWCLQLLLLLSLMRTPLFLLGVAIQARGNARISLHLTALRVGCALSMMVLLPLHDIGVVAGALLCAQGFGAIFVVAAARQQLHVGFLELGAALTAPLLFCAVGGGAVAAVLRFGHWQGWPLLLAVGALYSLLWGVLALPFALRLRGAPMVAVSKT